MFKFNSADEMYDYVVDKENDIYNPQTEDYVFHYNDKEAVCVYTIDNEQAEQFAETQREYGDYWGASLGIGGSIYDNPYDYFESVILDGWCNSSDYIKNEKSMNINNVEKTNIKPNHKNLGSR